jgi:hypothetical protein
MPGKGIGGHTLPNRGRTNDWITPRYVIEALGRFDLDPCQSLTQPWPCARRGYTVVEDGLLQEWYGRCYVNPPYGDEAWPFMERLAKHRNGIGLLFGRTETQMFSKHIWFEADAILFLAGRLTFYRPDGTKAKGNSGGPSVLVAYGGANVDALRKCGLPGALVTGWKVQNMGPKCS